ncbi:hypothetical protein IMCC3135_19570 [Granulosicoccus antarcticus IMCC3135]|uniref:Uncharacterized protein n=1 Tax=Granulosicoccus antarcticus IMCC3135 TaxID=1192854 RepID=A0A2Z2NRL0_9GAMM|nr:hypothetical protein IMCC3135_19570 [Granulosicoccus antarcticus IMCC3135]
MFSIGRVCAKLGKQPLHQRRRARVGNGCDGAPIEYGESAHLDGLNSHQLIGFKDKELSFVCMSKPHRRLEEPMRSDAIGSDGLRENASEINQSQPRVILHELICSSENRSIEFVPGIFGKS